MLKFNAHAFHASITLLTQLLVTLDASYEADGFTPAKEYCIFVPGEQMDDTSLLVVKTRVKNLKKALKPLNVPTTEKEVSRLLSTLESKYINFGECRLSLLQIDSRLKDELGSVILYSVNSRNIEYLSDKPLFGIKVFKAFPGANTDIMEAGKCLAFERPTAAVLHLMRALEHPLRTMADALSVPVKDNWNKILTDIQNKVRDVDDSGKRQKPPYWEGKKRSKGFIWMLLCISSL